MKKFHIYLKYFELVEKSKFEENKDKWWAKFVFEDNPVQNIQSKVKKSNKIGQEE